MRFYCFSSEQSSSLTNQAAHRDWWSVSTIDSLPSGITRNAALLIEIAGHSQRKQVRQWLSRADLSGPAFVIDQTATEEDVIEWLDRAATDVLDDAVGAVDLVEALSVQDGGPSKILGNSARTEFIREKVRLVAARRCNVLIEGETGTGKEVVARSIHIQSDKRTGPWVTVNCAAIPEALLEAELFGHVKGAFTGAVQGRAGKFEAANHGTIFLDEIGDMPFAVQSKLLRVLQEREVERLGGNERISLDVRVLAATNARLEELVRQGRFRQDLFFRLNVVRISIPALRDRMEDLELLARKFVHRTCRAEALPPKHLSVAAAEKLRMHNWPGNVRELENTIESAVILSGGSRILQAEHIECGESAIFGTEPAREPFDLPAGGIEYQKALENFERHLLTQALTRVRGNKTAAAELLGLKRTTLSAKLRTLESRMPRLVA